MSASVARAAGVGTSYGAAGVGGDGASRAPPAALDELREETAREAALNEVFRKEFAREQRRLQRSVDDIVDAALQTALLPGELLPKHLVQRSLPRSLLAQLVQCRGGRARRAVSADARGAVRGPDAGRPGDGR